MNRSAWAKRARAFSIGCLLFTSIFLLSPTSVDAFSWSDIPLIGGWFASPKASDLSVTLKTKLPEDMQWQEYIHNVGTGGKVEFKIIVTNNDNAQFTDLSVLIIPEENLSIEQDRWEIERLGRNDTHEITLSAGTNDKNIAVSQNTCNLMVVNLIYGNESVANDTVTVCVAHDLDSFGKVLGSGVFSGSSPSTGIFDVSKTVTVPLITFILGLVAYTTSLIIEKRFL